MSLNLGTYSNLENHPRMLRLRNIKSKAKAEAEPVKRIVLDPKTGFPSVVDPAASAPEPESSGEDSDVESQGELPLLALMPV